MVRGELGTSLAFFNAFYCSSSRRNDTKWYVLLEQLVKWIVELSQDWNESVHVRHSPHETFQLITGRQRLGMFNSRSFSQIKVSVGSESYDFLDDTPKAHFKESILKLYCLHLTRTFPKSFVWLITSLDFPII